MKSREAQISRHVTRYYRSLYRGEKSCSVPILQGWPLAEALGYPAPLERIVPRALWSVFVPCGNPLPLLRNAAAGVGLNLGCGAGIDAIALHTVREPVGPIVNLDPVFGILEKGRRLLPEPSGRNGTISWCAGEGEDLPLRDGAFQWVLMNGVFSLFPNKGQVLGEIHRILGRTGQLVICDLFHEGDLPDYYQGELDAWAWCMSGSVNRSRIKEVLQKAGFRLDRFEPREKMDQFCRAILSADKD